MIRFVYRIIPQIIPRIIPAFFSIVLMVGCGQTSNPSSGTPANTPPPQASPPPTPQPPQLSLYMVPLNQAEFSMESIQANKRTIEKEPNNVKALLSLADANFMIQRFEKSQEYYERALKGDPKNGNARIGLANTYIFLQKPDEAIRQLDQLLKMQKDYPEALFNKGLILLRSKGDAAGAKAAWTRLMQSHPDHELAKEVKDELGKM